VLPLGNLTGGRVRNLPGMKPEERIDYCVDGLHVKAILLLPEGAGPFPGLVVNHGGMSGIDERVLNAGRRLRDRGYVVILPSFRGEDGSEGALDVAAGDVRDSLAALDLLSARDDVDANRIGMWGNSRGGLTTLLAAQQAKSLRCAATSAAILSAEDLFEIFASRQDPQLAEVLRMMGGTPQEQPEEYARRSPLTHIERLRCPVLVLHAEDDAVVNIRSAHEIRNALERTDHPEFAVKTFASGGHRVVFDNPEAGAALDAFLDRHLCGD
jgi:dipeptidyl aminopeptidase/acylaminoacyl peptidase